MTSSEQPIIILLVEDSADDAFFFQRAVKKCGVTTETHLATDGVEAMDYLLNRGRFEDAAAHPSPHIMFLDLKLPHANGFEVLEWMRRHAECPQPPVVVLTSSSQPEDQERAEALDAVLFLTKPPTPEQLAHVLRKFRGAKPETVSSGLPGRPGPGLKDK